MKNKAYNQVQVFEAATSFAKTKGRLAAPEPSHATKGVVDEALKCKGVMLLVAEMIAQ